MNSGASYVLSHVLLSWHIDLVCVCKCILLYVFCSSTPRDVTDLLTTLGDYLKKQQAPATRSTVWSSCSIALTNLSMT